jgi:LysM repeat protein
MDIQALVKSKQAKYAVVAAVGIGGVWWWRNQHAAVTTDTPDLTDTSDVAADAADSLGLPTYGGPGGYYGSGQAASNTDLTGDSGATDTTNTTTTPTATNASWVQNAIALLSGYGRDSGTVLTALSKYLSGAPITTAEQGIVQQALAVAGQPPTAAPPVTISTKPPVSTSTKTTTTTSTPKPKTSSTSKPKTESKVISYKIKSGDTLSEIAQKYHTTVAKLASLNGIKNPNLIYAGHTLKIPG